MEGQENFNTQIRCLLAYTVEQQKREHKESHATIESILADLLVYKLGDCKQPSNFVD